MRAVDPTGLACTKGALDLIRAGDLTGALAALAQGACAEPSEDPCIALATLTVSDDGDLTVDAPGPRALVPTNLMLMQMVACLAARIEECCAHPSDATTENPSLRESSTILGSYLGARENARLVSR